MVKGCTVQCICRVPLTTKCCSINRNNCVYWWFLYLFFLLMFKQQMQMQCFYKSESQKRFLILHKLHYFSFEEVNLHIRLDGTFGNIVSEEEYDVPDVTNSQTCRTYFCIRNIILRARVLRNCRMFASFLEVFTLANSAYNFRVV